MAAVQETIEQVTNVRGGKTWLVNPGTVAGLAAPATWIFGDLESMRFEVRKLQIEFAQSMAP